jgi:hypothetical protein
MGIAVLTVAGCGAARHQNTLPAITASTTSVVAARCPSGTKSARPLTLLLTDRLPQSRLQARVGQVVNVVSPYGGAKMQFAGAHPAADTCVLSERRSADGRTSVKYRLVHAGSIYFSASFVKATDAEMPAMGGRVIVSPSHRAS